MILFLLPFDRYYKIFNEGKISDIIREYKEISSVLNTDVQVNRHNQLIAGHAIDIDEDGALILRMDSGLHERVVSGDVEMLR